MRLFWTGVLITGLVLIGAATYDRQASDQPELTSSLAEDGTGFPEPYPTPTPKP